ncbi:microtubule-associated protein RP/EB family member 1C-like [Iris pallida]|uniref:Microtubule-associated protein RP/EB family member 1C-like n=1 Tax=Iris pallida TaxID=29817 RepID=A0AAX6G6S3_IRIPA|nr:microtubule-associated protein RP/EB family member 1C-like [Iris pallida]
MANNIGMMDAAYFVGRGEILAWINSTLQLNLSKVEEASGAGGGAVSADGRGAPGAGADAQGQLRREERVRDDPELQGPSGRLQQAQDHQAY